MAKETIYPRPRTSEEAFEQARQILTDFVRKMEAKEAEAKKLEDEKKNG